MPGVPRFSANPLLQQVNNAAAQRGPAPRGSVPISTLLQNQSTPDPGDGGLLGGVAIPPPPAPDSESILGGLQPGQFSARATDPFASEPGFEAPVNPGVGANDDSGQFYGGATSAEQAALQQAIADDTANARPQQAVEATGTFNGMTRPPIKPQGNVLDKFSSYTYQIGVYLLSPVQYEQFVKSKKKSINGYNLLFQSGGAPTNTGGFQAALAPGGQTFFENDGTASFSSAAPTSAQADAGRNPAFPLDFYIQECHVTNLLQGKGTGMSHSAATLKFTVIEPVGITLIDRIYQAVQDIAPRNSQNRINYANAQYLMVIRWFGYDQNGNITGGSSANTDPRSAVEKFIPFVINRINWRVNTKATEYEFDCTPVQQIVAAGTRRGVVPYDIQLSRHRGWRAGRGPRCCLRHPPPPAPRGRDERPLRHLLPRAGRGRAHFGPQWGAPRRPHCRLGSPPAGPGGCGGRPAGRAPRGTLACAQGPALPAHAAVGPGPPRPGNRSPGG